MPKSSTADFKAMQRNLLFAGPERLLKPIRGLGMVKTLGIIMGLAFLFGGILGFVPGVTHDGMYFGIFMVNTPHNILHIASGTIFVTASVFGARPARLWF